MLFYNRKNELTFLESKFQSNQPELLVFWGRRRVGKIVIGEIKWTDSPCPKKVYDNLVQKLPKVENPLYVIISKSSFAENLIQLQNDSLVLIDLDQCLLINDQ